MSDLSKKIKDSWSNAEFLIDIPINNEEYKELLDFIKPIIIEEKYRNYNSLDDDTLRKICICMVQIIFRNNKKNFWDEFEDVIGCKLTNFQKNDLGDMFTAFCIETNKYTLNSDIRRQNVNNICMHSFIANYCIGKTVTFLYKSYMYEKNCDIDSILDDESYIDNMIDVIINKENEEETASYHLNAQISQCASLNRNYVKDKMIKMLEIIDCNFRNESNKIKNLLSIYRNESKIFDLTNKWMNEHRTIHEEFLRYKKRNVNKTDVRFLSPHIEIDIKNTTFNTYLIIPEQKLFKNDLMFAKDDKIEMECEIIFDGIGKDRRKIVKKIKANCENTPTMYITEPIKIQILNKDAINNITITIKHLGIPAALHKIDYQYIKGQRLRYQLFINKDKKLCSINKEKYYKNDIVYCIYYKKNNNYQVPGGIPFDRDYILYQLPIEVKNDDKLAVLPDGSYLGLGISTNRISNDFINNCHIIYDNLNINIIRSFPSIKIKTNTRNRKAFIIYIIDVISGERTRIYCDTNEYNRKLVESRYIYEKSNKYELVFNLKYLQDNFKNKIYDIIIEEGERKKYAGRFLYVKDGEIIFNKEEYSFNESGYLVFNNFNNLTLISDTEDFFIYEDEYEINKYNFDTREKEYLNFYIKINKSIIKLAVKIPYKE